MNHDISNKRILRDIMDIKKNPLDNDGIFIHVEEDNIKKIKACIIGPENTPYQNGFYLFDITFPKEYPFKPPIVKYQTRYKDIRFNPNLYTCGKVCISILNTWSGPQWTSCQTLRSVLLSLQTIFHENPLHNEPGYENDNTITNKKYNDVITYQNINTSIYYLIDKMIKDGFQGFEVFKDIIIKQFINKYDDIIKQLDYFKNRNDEIISCIYSMTYLIMYHSLKNNLKKLYQKLYPDYQKNNIEEDIKNDKVNKDDITDKDIKEDIIIDIKINDINKDEIQIDKIEHINTNKTINKRKAPNQKANLFDIGYQTKSDNDNQIYIVYQDKNGVKKWKKYK